MENGEVLSLDPLHNLWQRHSLKQKFTIQHINARRMTIGLRDLSTSEAGRAWIQQVRS